MAGSGFTRAVSGVVRTAVLALAVFAGTVAIGHLTTTGTDTETPAPVSEPAVSPPTPVAADSTTVLSASEQAVIALFERVSPSVVQIISESGGNAFLGTTSVATGTGFIWDEAGHIVTNNHVVADGDMFTVRLASGAVLGAELVGTAPNYDLAVLALKNETELPPPIPLGSSEGLQVGQTALAIGSPFGLDQSLTTGIISALHRRLPTETGREISDVIQTDAAINPGNSGGPLLDSSGRIVGVNSAIFSPSGANAGIGFAIPAAIVQRVVPELIENGHYPTPGIGIVPADDTIATRLGVEGVVVSQIYSGSPAADAGLRGINFQRGTVGDIIVEVNGERVQRLADLTDALESVGIGESVELGVLRSGQIATLDIDVVDIGNIDGV